MKWLDEIPILMLATVAILLALAPFSPEPHLLEKLKMLVAGSLKKPIDIFDLIMHSSGIVLLLIKAGRMAYLKNLKT